MKRLIASMGVGLALTMGTLASPASAHHITDGPWTMSHYQACCWGDLWYSGPYTYTYQGKTWSGWEYYNGVIQGQVSVFGPIMGVYSNHGWEAGPLGAPRNSPHFSHWGQYGAVYQQHFDHGIIRWHTWNGTSLYDWGGYAEVIMY